jgi:circadian clock protein KaiC
MDFSLQLSITPQLINMTSLSKVKTGINGLDQITNGGIPQGRTTLICGGTGCGKTLLSVEFIVKGATLYNEPGVFVAFEEKAEELAANVASLGFDLLNLQKTKKVRLDYVHIDRSQIEETGEYDLEGLFIRLAHAIDSIGAKRVVLDTIENLFSGLTNQGILRAELRRLFHWLKDKGVTAIVTAEKGEGTLTRHGLEEYVSDCVIQLDNRIIDQVTTRRLRIVKYRGSMHGTNEYPFLIDEDGISVLPITSMRLGRSVSSQRISSGVAGLDKMLGGKGFFRGSSILVSGTSGTGKTSIASSFANATCSRNEKCLYFAYEESPQQILRNMKSIGMDLDKHVKKGLLEFHSIHPTEFGLEMHLVTIHKMVRKFKPRSVIIDPITNFISVGVMKDVKAMLIRLVDILLDHGITVMLTALNITGTSADQTDEVISSIVDSWIQIRDVELNGERNRALYVMKSRGMKHSSQVREFVITDDGLELVDVYVGENGILVGSARHQAQKLHESGTGLLSLKLRKEIAQFRQNDGSILTGKGKKTLK